MWLMLRFVAQIKRGKGCQPQQTLCERVLAHRRRGLLSMASPGRRGGVGSQVLSWVLLLRASQQVRSHELLVPIEGMICAPTARVSCAASAPRVVTVRIPWLQLKRIEFECCSS